MKHEFISINGNYSQKSWTRIIIANEIKEGKKVMICAHDKKSALIEISFIKNLMPDLKLKINHRYKKHTVHTFINELSENPFMETKTNRVYIGAIVFLQ